LLEACGWRTEANVEHIRQESIDFILAINHREVLSLVEKHGPHQLGLFDERNIADVSIDGRRLVVCPQSDSGRRYEKTQGRVDKINRGRT